MRGAKQFFGAAVTAFALGFASSAPARAATAVINDTTDMPEVEVVGRRLYQMQKAIMGTEDKFFARYNELNKNDAFDVHCSMSTPTGSHIHKRICQVQFYVDAQVEYARSELNNDSGAPPPDLVALERAPEYKKTALAVINGDPELRRLVRTRDTLEQKYLTARKEAFKHHWVGF
jgi:hypothetical protein